MADARHMFVLVHGRLDDVVGNQLSLVEQALLRRRRGRGRAAAIVVQTGAAGLSARQRGALSGGMGWEAEDATRAVLDALEWHGIGGGGGAITDLSFFAFGAGGLVARCVVGILYQRGVFRSVRPRNFDTFGTPHVGLAMPVSRVERWTGLAVLGVVCEQLLCVDDWEGSGRALVDVMSDPAGVFYRGLALFESIRVYANAIDDGFAPYMSGAIEDNDPFVDHETSDVFVETYAELGRYPSIIKSWNPPSGWPPARKSWLRHVKDWRGEVCVGLLVLLAVLFVYYTGPDRRVEAVTLIAMPLTAVFVCAKLKRVLLARDFAKRPRLLEFSTVFESQGPEMSSSTFAAHKQTRHVQSPPGSFADPNFPENDLGYSAVQYRAIKALNELPQLRKEIVWRPGCSTMHQALFGLDKRGFQSDERAGAFQHWQNGLLL